MITRDERGLVSFGRFDYVVQGLIFLSLVQFSVETLPNLDEDWRRILGRAETVIVTLFTAEYLARAFLSRPRKAYVLSFFGLIDLLAIVPFFIGMGVDLRSLRAFRFLRLIQIMKLTRYSRALQRMRSAIMIVREELLLFGSIAMVLLYLASVGIYYFEHQAQPAKFASVFDGMWWAVCTLTTVGYGDVYPITAGGKFFTFIVLLIGLGIVAVPTGLLASALTHARNTGSGETTTTS